MKPVALVFGPMLLLASAVAGAAPCAGFTDVDDTDWFCPNVAWMKAREPVLEAGVFGEVNGGQKLVAAECGDTLMALEFPEFCIAEAEVPETYHVHPLEAVDALLINRSLFVSQLLLQLIFIILSAGKNMLKRLGDNTAAFNANMVAELGHKGYMRLTDATGTIHGLG